MITVKVQTNNKRKFTIPVPYSFLNVINSFVSSKFLWRQINKWAIHHAKKNSITYEPLDFDSKIIKNLLTPVIKEIKHQKGLVIVDIKLQDGTKVMVKL